MTAAADTSVLFVGLGTMGAPMVRNLATLGADLHLHDIDPARAAELAAEVSATAVTDLPAAGAKADVVVLMLPSSGIVADVMDGDGGLLAALRPGSLVIDMSSSEPARTIDLAHRAAGLGVEVVDAPVSGGRRRAVTGDLAIMVGGTPAAVERARPYLETMGSSVITAGGSGAAHAVKALNNLLSAVGLAASVEVLAIGRRFGLDPAVVLDILNRSSGRNNSTETKIAPFVLSRSFDAGFSLELMVKDMGIAMDLARSGGVAAPISAAAMQTWTGARTMLAGQAADHTEVARFVERDAGVALAGGPTATPTDDPEEDR